MLQRFTLLLSTAAMLLMLAATPALAYPGAATWYDLPGNYTASGDVFESHDYTAASNVYPFGTYLTVCHEGCVTVVVTDTGGFGHDLDLSLGAAEAIGMVEEGYAPVSIHEAGADPTWGYYKQY